MKTILLIIWLVFLILILIDWVARALKRRKISKMTNLEKIAYMTDEYGKNWQDHNE